MYSGGGARLFKAKYDHRAHLTLPETAPCAWFRCRNNADADALCARRWGAALPPRDFMHSDLWTTAGMRLSMAGSFAAQRHV